MSLNICCSRSSQLVTKNPPDRVVMTGFELTKLIVLLIFQILHHNDIIMILYWTYEFRFKIRVSNFVSVLNFSS